MCCAPARIIPHITLSRNGNWNHVDGMRPAHYNPHCTMQNEPNAFGLPIPGIIALFECLHRQAITTHHAFADVLAPNRTTTANMLKYVFSIALHYWYILEHTHIAPHIIVEMQFCYLGDLMIALYVFGACEICSVIRNIVMYWFRWIRAREQFHNGASAVWQLLMWHMIVVVRYVRVNPNFRAWLLLYGLQPKVPELRAKRDVWRVVLQLKCKFAAVELSAIFDEENTKECRTWIREWTSSLFGISVVLTVSIDFGWAFSSNISVEFKVRSSTSNEEVWSLT